MLIGNSPAARGRYELDILAKHASGVTRLGRLPSSPSSGELLCWNVELDKALRSIDCNRITFPHQCDQSPLVSFRRHMTHNHAPGSTGNAPVSQKAYRCAEPLSDEGGGWRKHFLHAGSALWTLVANHHDIARLDLFVQDRSHAFGLRIKYACRAGD